MAALQRAWNQSSLALLQSGRLAATATLGQVLRYTFARMAAAGGALYIGAHR